MCAPAEILKLTQSQISVGVIWNHWGWDLFFNLKQMARSIFFFVFIIKVLMISCWFLARHLWRGSKALGCSRNSYWMTSALKNLTVISEQLWEIILPPSSNVQYNAFVSLMSSRVCVFVRMSVYVCESVWEYSEKWEDVYTSSRTPIKVRDYLFWWAQWRTSLLIYIRFGLY